jgi:hypothetical protein
VSLQELTVFLEEIAIRVKVWPTIHAPNLTQTAEVLVRDVGEFFQLFAHLPIQMTVVFPSWTLVAFTLTVVAFI